MKSIVKKKVEKIKGKASLFVKMNKWYDNDGSSRLYYYLAESYRVDGKSKVRILKSITEEEACLYRDKKEVIYLGGPGKMPSRMKVLSLVGLGSMQKRIIEIMDKGGWFMVCMVAEQLTPNVYVSKTHLHHTRKSLNRLVKRGLVLKRIEPIKRSYRPIGEKRGVTKNVASYYRLIAVHYIG